MTQNADSALGLPRDVYEMLTEDERTKLQADLAEIAACRRRAWAAHCNDVLGAPRHIDGSGAGQ